MLNIATSRCPRSDETERVLHIGLAAARKSRPQLRQNPPQNSDDEAYLLLVETIGAIRAELVGMNSKEFPAGDWWSVREVIRSMYRFRGQRLSRTDIEGAVSNPTLPYVHKKDRRVRCGPNSSRRPRFFYRVAVRGGGSK